MKKIHVGTFILSNSWGGAEESTATIARYVDTEHFDVSILANDFLAKKYEADLTIPIHNVGYLESNKRLHKLYTLFSIQNTLRKIVRDSQIDIIHARLENTVLALSTMVPSLPVPVIFTLSGDETRIYHAPKTFEQKMIRRGIRLLLDSSTDQVSSVSRWLIKEFAKQDRDRIAVTHNGVDTDFFTPASPTTQSTNSVLYVGRLVAGKGIEDLVEVAKQLPQYEFWFVGRGHLEHLISLPNTKYLGFKTRKEIALLYAQATICAFPSYAEGMPMVGLEAMACGKAVVASYHGFSEYVDDGVDGIIIEPGNIEQISVAIQSLFEDDAKREAFEKAARKKALTYDIHKTVMDYEEVYKRVATR